MHIIVDGYNLIRQSEALRRFERISLEAGRRELIRRLSLYKKNKGHKVTVVFDGWISGSPTEEREREGGITVVYSKLGEKADEVIKRLVRKGAEEILVVTSDREIADAALRSRSAAISVRDFESRLSNSLSSSLAKQASEDLEDSDRETHGTRKKGPSRRLSKKEKTAISRLKKL